MNSRLIANHSRSVALVLAWAYAYRCPEIVDQMRLVEVPKLQSKRPPIRLSTLLHGFQRHMQKR